MIEAYEIGIKLALQDGVSDGIAAIRRDLGSLDQAISQTTLRLGQLQRIGIQAMAASQEQPERVASSLMPRKPASIIMPLSPPESETAALPVETKTGSPTRALSARVPANVLAAPPTTQVPVGDPGPSFLPVLMGLDATAPAVAARPPAPVVEVARPADNARLSEQSLAPPAVSAVPTALPAAAGTNGGQVAPKLQLGEPLPPAGERPWRQMYQPASLSVLPPVPSIRAQAPPPVPAEARGRGKTRIMADESPAMPGTRPRLHAAVSDWPATRVAPAPAKPAALLSSAPSTASTPAPSYAPPASSSRPKETSMRGDVFLDGARVGRWMSEQMARDAGRPNTGPTGFDPRRSAAWPGAAVTW